MPSRQSAPIAAQPAPTMARAHWRIERAAVTPRKSSPAPSEAIGHRTRPIVQSSGSRGESRRVKTPEAERGEVFAGTASFRMCVTGHRMSKQLAPTEGCWCDECGTVVNKGDEMLGCRRCNFDLCPDCVRESGDTPRARRQGLDKSASELLGVKAEMEMREKYENPGSERNEEPSPSPEDDPEGDDRRKARQRPRQGRLEGKGRRKRSSSFSAEDSGEEQRRVKRRPDRRGTVRDDPEVEERTAAVRGVRESRRDRTDAEGRREEPGRRGTGRQDFECREASPGTWRPLSAREDLEAGGRLAVERGGQRRRHPVGPEERSDCEEARDTPRTVRKRAADRSFLPPLAVRSAKAPRRD